MKGEERPYLKSMDSHIKESGGKICFHEMIRLEDPEEAMKIFKEHGDESYMEIALNESDYYRKETKRLWSIIKKLNKELHSCRRDLFSLRKERGDRGGTIKMYLETGAVLDMIPTEDYFVR